MSALIENDDSHPLVSVVIPSYNHAVYIQECITSVIAQDYQNIELIVIDDGSCDDSVKMIQELVPACQKRFVRFEFRSRSNKGLPATMNEALAWAQGTYFSFIASDDLILPTRTTVLVESILMQKNIAGVFCGRIVIDENNNIISIDHVASAVVCDFEDVFLSKYTLPVPSMLVDLKLMKSVGGYDEKLFYEDRYMWLKLTSAGYKLMVLPDVLVKYRVHDENMSKNLVKMLDSRIKLAEMYKQHRYFPYVMASIYAASALEYSEVSRTESFSKLAKSLQYSWKVVFTHNFMYALVKTLFPKAALNFVKGIR
jgi:alpha-1,3-rhamnosyltransferase